MPTFNSPVAVVQLNPEIGTRLSPINVQGTLYEATVLWTVEATAVATDIIRLIRLPQGARLIPSLCHIENESAGSAYTFHVGDDDVAGVGAAADADRYAISVATASAGGRYLTGNDGAATLTPYVLGADAWIQATLTVVTTPTVGAKIRFSLVYALVA